MDLQISGEGAVKVGSYSLDYRIGLVGDSIDKIRDEIRAKLEIHDNHLADDLARCQDLNIRAGHDSLRIDGLFKNTAALENDSREARAKLRNVPDDLVGLLNTMAMTAAEEKRARLGLENSLQLFMLEVGYEVAMTDEVPAVPAKPAIPPRRIVRKIAKGKG
jgi:hypothetical protein